MGFITYVMWRRFDLNHIDFGSYLFFILILSYFSTYVEANSVCLFSVISFENLVKSNKTAAKIKRNHKTARHHNKLNKNNRRESIFMFSIICERVSEQLMVYNIDFFSIISWNLIGQLKRKTVLLFDFEVCLRFKVSRRVYNYVRVSIFF